MSIVRLWETRLIPEQKFLSHLEAKFAASSRVCNFNDFYALALDRWLQSGFREISQNERNCEDCSTRLDFYK